MNASKHLLEMLLEARYVLAVANNLEQILVTDEVESILKCHKTLHNC